MDEKVPGYRPYMAVYSIQYNKCLRLKTYACDLGEEYLALQQLVYGDLLDLL